LAVAASARWPGPGEDGPLAVDLAEEAEAAALPGRDGDFLRVAMSVLSFDVNLIGRRETMTRLRAATAVPSVAVFAR
jgi:hypothetical protein